MFKIIKNFTLNSFRSLTKNQKKIPNHVCSWGLGEDGRLGHNNSLSIKYPKFLPSEWFSNKKITKVFTGGGGHSYAISEDNSVFTWGNNFHGQLGIGDDDNCLGPYEIENEIFKEFKNISTGDNHTLAVTHDGDVYSWGFGGNLFNHGALGHGNRKNLKVPKKIEGLSKDEKFIQVACGKAHSAALTEDGHVYTWGVGEWGRLGSGSNKAQPKPVLINPQFINNEKAIKISLGRFYSSILTDKGNLYMFGKNDNFQLGIQSSGSFLGGATFDAQSLPTLLTFFPENDIKITDVCTGDEYTGIVAENGEAWFWGKGVFEPTKVEKLTNVKSVSVGDNHLAFITKDKGTYIMGKSNRSYQIGVKEKSMTSNINTVYKIDETKYVHGKFESISCGENYTLAIMKID